MVPFEEEEENRAAVGLGHAIADVVSLRMREREMMQTIKDQAQKIKDMETVFLDTTNRLKKRIAELEAQLAPEAPKPIYTAIFLSDVSKEVLLKLFPPIHPKVFGHHVTLAFKPTPEAIKAYEPFLGHEVVVEVIGVASDDKGQAVKVQVPTPYGELWEQNHHVTISCVSSPVYSNELLAKGWKSIDAPVRLTGVVRHFTK